VPDTLKNVKKFLENASKEPGKNYKVVASDSSQQAREHIQRTRHDIKGALRTLSLAANEIAEGRQLTAKDLDILRDACQILQREFGLLFSIYSD